MDRTLVTSALPYANGYLHLGHCAGAYLPADIYVRYKRLSGERLLYVCGSDEHGVAITIAAEKEKVPPQAIIDKYHYANEEAFNKFGMSFDIYSRTSHAIHHETAREFFKHFLNNGLLVEKEEDQFYDPKANMFLPDRYVEGVCPNCGHDKARGDQCDNCGAYYDQLELKDPVSLVSGETPVVRKTTHWYMKLGDFQQFLEDYIEGHAGDWKDNVLQQTRSWLKLGLTDRAITRDLDWGVKLDEIEGIPPEKAKGKALYVWFDAVLGYISATKELMIELEKTGKAAAADWKDWWQNPDTRYLAFIGKDNIVFHTLIFPAMLHGRGNGYILPDNVPANEFLNLEGKKFSKSRNWSIDLKDFVNDFPEPHSIDALRYTLAMNFPETKDADFTWKDFQARNNNELSAIFGNFVNRTLQFIHKNFGGKVPQLPEKYKGLPASWKTLADKFAGSTGLNKDNHSEAAGEFNGMFSENDILLIYSLSKGVKASSELIERFRFRDALTEIMNVARAANKYFNDEEPWKSVKSAPDEAAKTLYICSQLVNSLAVLFAPVTPLTSAKIYEFFGLEPRTGSANRGFPEKENYWLKAMYPALPEGLEIQKPGLLFVRVEDKTVKEQVDKLGAKTVKEEDLITIDDFKKVQLRTAKIIAAEKVRKSKKLLKLQVDLGDEKRQILAGVADYYKPEELVGKMIVVVANLQPAKLMGEESQGMMLAASNEDGKLCFLTPSDENIGAGARIS